MTRYRSIEKEALIADFKTLAMCAVPPLLIASLNVASSVISDDATVPYNYVLSRELDSGHRVFSGVEASCNDRQADGVARVALMNIDVVVVDEATGTERGGPLAPTVITYVGESCDDALKNARTGGATESPIVQYILDQLGDDTTEQQFGSLDAGSVLMRSISLAMDNSQVGRL